MIIIIIIFYKQYLCRIVLLAIAAFLEMAIKKFPIFWISERVILGIWNFLGLARIFHWATRFACAGVSWPRIFCRKKVQLRLTHFENV